MDRPIIKGTRYLDGTKDFGYINIIYAIMPTPYMEYGHIGISPGSNCDLYTVCGHGDAEWAKKKLCEMVDLIIEKQKSCPIHEKHNP